MCLIGNTKFAHDHNDQCNNQENGSHGESAVQGARGLPFAGFGCRGNYLDGCIIGNRVQTVNAGLNHALANVLGVFLFVVGNLNRDGNLNDLRAARRPYGNIIADLINFLN